MTWSRLVRPSGGFSPTSVAGLMLWYDLTNCTHTTTVSALPDSSGNGRNATLTGSPAFTSSNASYNSRPTAKRADASNVIQMPDMGITTGAFTIVFVGDAPTASFNYLLRGGGVDLRAQSSMFRLSANGGSTLLDSASITTTNPAVVIAVVNGASSKMYASKKTAVSGSSGTQPNMTGVGMCVGDTSVGGGGGDLNFTHALVYSGALSNTDCVYLLNGFGAQCGISIGA